MSPTNDLESTVAQTAKKLFLPGAGGSSEFGSLSLHTYHKVGLKFGSAGLAWATSRPLRTLMVWMICLAWLGYHGD